MNGAFDDEEAARSLVKVVGDSRWVAATLAKAFQRTRAGGSEDEVVQLLHEEVGGTKRQAREYAAQLRSGGFLRLVPERERTGSAENPVTKLFPAAITEMRFTETLDDLCDRCSGLRYEDDREAGHTYVDFRLIQGALELPINVKNAGTRFERAAELVGLAPEDSIPIPAYKAYGAVEVKPSLVYAVAIDYELVGTLNRVLPALLSREEHVVWELLKTKAGLRLKRAEDDFVRAVTLKHWARLRDETGNRPFNVVSARKAIRVLQTKPKRTPGIGLKAWGTGASAEVNVHLSVAEDTTPWALVEARIVAGGLQSVIDAVNRRRTELVYDPEI